VAALALALPACLVAPPADDRDGPPIGSTNPDGGAPPDADAAACADSFAVAYASAFDVRRTADPFPASSSSVPSATASTSAR
jgi:hypothetical protein